MADRSELSQPVAYRTTSEGIGRLTLNNPPYNLLDPKMIASLHSLIEGLEDDKSLKVVIVDSADPDFFMSHVDLLQAGSGNDGVGPTGLAPWPDFLRRLEKAEYITIGLLRGRARGVGSEILQALDMRFASKENARLAQIEVGCGIIPGGGGLERLPRMVGRGRAMEIICGADDFDADTAAAYGWVNRAIPDGDIDTFVNKLAHRIASFDRRALALAKSVVNERVGLASNDELNSTYDRFLATLQWPETRARLQKMLESGLQSDHSYEMDIPEKLLELA